VASRSRHTGSYGDWSSDVCSSDLVPAVELDADVAFPWIERDIGIEFDRWDMPKVDPRTMQSTLPNVFFGGDAAFGPKNIIWAVEIGRASCRERASRRPARDAVERA